MAAAVTAAADTFIAPLTRCCSAESVAASAGTIASKSASRKFRTSADWRPRPACAGHTAAWRTLRVGRGAEGSTPTNATLRHTASLNQRLTAGGVHCTPACPWFPHHAGAPEAHGPPGLGARDELGQGVDDLTVDTAVTGGSSCGQLGELPLQRSLHGSSNLDCLQTTRGRAGLQGSWGSMGCGHEVGARCGTGVRSVERGGGLTCCSPPPPRSKTCDTIEATCRRSVLAGSDSPATTGWPEASYRLPAAAFFCDTPSALQERLAASWLLAARRRPRSCFSRLASSRQRARSIRAALSRCVAVTSAACTFRSCLYSRFRASWWWRRRLWTVAPFFHPACGPPYGHRDGPSPGG